MEDGKLYLILISQRKNHILRNQPGQQQDVFCIVFPALHLHIEYIKLLHLDAVWENIVKVIGHIEVADGQTLTEQIDDNDQRAKLLAQIVTLERKMANEKQPRRKREYFEQIKKLKEQI